MRISVDPKDRGYDPVLSRTARVFLDGRPLTNCITADEEIGEAICYAIDEFGRLIAEGDRIKMETLKGVVKIETRS
jgi:hypothetical protein